MSDYIKLTIAMLRELWVKAPVKLKFTSSLETVHADCSLTLSPAVLAVVRVASSLTP